jgi:hypothetical protein
LPGISSSGAENENSKDSVSTGTYCTLLKVEEKKHDRKEDGLAMLQCSIQNPDL